MTDTLSPMDNWDIKRSAKLYGTTLWGSGYFSINEAGKLEVCPVPVSGNTVELVDVMERLEEQGITTPVVLRFDQIIASQIRRINEAFSSAIKETGYQNRYRLAYPIKVNQQAQVISAVQRGGKNFDSILEVGSKAELVVALSLETDQNEILLCNGYKDREYVELALLGRKLGKRVIIIVEQPYELSEILATSKKLEINAELGVRVKPLSQGSGKWEDSTGRDAKFGLTSGELLQFLEELSSAGFTQALKLLHIHMGSQVSSLSSIKNVVREAARIYAALSRVAPELSFFDIGGGLGIDYDSTGDFSIDYSIEEYAAETIKEIHSVFESESVKAPEIISESGRAILAHSSVLITEVTDVSAHDYSTPLPSVNSSYSKQTKELWELTQSNNPAESLAKPQQLFDEILSLFRNGNATLEERAYAESLYYRVCTGFYANNTTNRSASMQEAADTYFCNFSLFQSLPDSWAIRQPFPTLPIQRLNEEPTVRGAIADLTCDSDGRIKQFVSGAVEGNYARLHTVQKSDSYYIGIFLVGAYQETLGDLHNLFGRTHAAHIVVEGNKANIKEIVRGDSIGRVLAQVEFPPDELNERFKLLVAEAVSRKQLSNEAAKRFAKDFEGTLKSYTYLSRARD